MRDVRLEAWLVMAWDMAKAIWLVRRSRNRFIMCGLAGREVAAFFGPETNEQLVILSVKAGRST